MITTSKHKLLRALNMQENITPPVWLMRQAGRYLPEYKKIRSNTSSFMDFCCNPELAAIATLQPIKRFDLDAAILFSDILVIPNAMGCKVNFKESFGPILDFTISSPKDLHKLVDMEPKRELNYVYKAIEITKKELNEKVPLIGFVGSPWTIACYMMQGSSSRDFNIPRTLIYKDPVLVHKLLKKIMNACIKHLNEQIDAGVDVVMIFDTWGGLLPLELHSIFTLYYMKEIIKNIRKDIPCIIYTKSTHTHLYGISQSGCSAIGVDWTINLSTVYDIVGYDIAIQGNLDPMVLMGTKKQIKFHVEKILYATKDNPGYIFNLGHGIYKDTPIENVHYMLEIIHNSNNKNANS